MPEVSVIIPARNAARHIGRAVRSALAQTVRDIELIVIDDCSDDDTDAVAAAAGKEAVKIIRHTSNKGAGGARNSGIHASRGRYIAFLDSDDAWHPDKLEKQLALFKGREDSLACVYCGFSAFDPATGIKVGEIHPSRKGDIEAALLMENCVAGGGSTALVPRPLLEKAGFFDEKLATCEDWDLWLRLSRLGEFDFCPESLCDIYATPGSLSSDPRKMLAFREAMLEKHADAYLAKPRILAARYYVLGLQSARCGLADKAADYFIRAKDMDEYGPLFAFKCALHAGLLRKRPTWHAELLKRFY